jgi:3-oxoacyl-[acyl-carrier-protein] synthase II
MVAKMAHDSRLSISRWRPRGATAAGIDFEEDAANRRVVLNTGGGGLEQVIDGTHTYDSRGPRFVSPFAIPALSPSMGACMLSMEYGLTGPVMTQSAACATSIIAFHDALRLIGSGECDVVLAGGSEAPVLPMALAALGNMGALSKRNDDPAHASRPFDRGRDGFVLGEGGGVVVESAQHARAPRSSPRFRRRLTSDAPISALDPTGRGRPRDDERHAQLGRRPGRDRLIVAHGTSTSLNDSTETTAIKAAYGSAAAAGDQLPKSMIGTWALPARVGAGGPRRIRDGVIAPPRTSITRSRV